MIETSPKIPRVAVIGAGIAGLSCATRLQELGFQVHVYEKSTDPSGRMSTRISDHWSADHGAQYFTARDPLFIQELNSWIQADVAAPWHPHLKVFKDNQWQDKVSRETRYVGSPGMNSPGKHLAQDLSITFNQTIDHICYKNEKWLLHSIETGSIEQQYDWLILALPAPQTRTLTKSIDESFNSLGTKVNMRGCWTVMVRCAQNLDMPFDAGFVNNEIISWVSRNNSKPGRAGDESWTIHTNPEWSEQHLNSESEEVIRLIIRCAEKLGFDFCNSTMTSHRWRYDNVHIDPSPQFHLQKKCQLGICGDWLHDGRVEGAWLSGYKIANKISSLS